MATAVATADGRFPEQGIDLTRPGGLAPFVSYLDADHVRLAFGTTRNPSAMDRLMPLDRAVGRAAERADFLDAVVAAAETYLEYARGSRWGSEYTDQDNAGVEDKLLALVEPRRGAG